MTTNQVLGRVEFRCPIEAEIWAKRHAHESCLPFQYWKIELDAELKRFFVAVYSKNTRTLNGFAQ